MFFEEHHPALVLAVLWASTLFATPPVRIMRSAHSSSTRPCMMDDPVKTYTAFQKWWTSWQLLS